MPLTPPGNSSSVRVGHSRHVPDGEVARQVPRGECTPRSGLMIIPASGPQLATVTPRALVTSAARKCEANNVVRICI